MAEQLDMLAGVEQVTLGDEPAYVPRCDCGWRGAASLTEGDAEASLDMHQRSVDGPHERGRRDGER